MQSHINRIFKTRITTNDHFIRNRTSNFVIVFVFESKFLSCDTMCIILMKVNIEINKQVNSVSSHIRNLPKLIKQLLTYTFNAYIGFR